MKNLMLGLLLLCTSAPAFAEFSNESSLGLVITSGNSKTETFNAKTMDKYVVEKSTFRFDGAFLRAKQKGVLNAKNWLLGLRYERELSPQFSGFLAQSVEGDRFAGILQRYNSDLGGKYFFYKIEKELNWFAEAGYRFTRERGTNGVTRSFNKARVYTEAEKYFTPSTSAKFWVEYVPNFTESKSWLLNTELSVASALGSVFSIQSAYLLRYNNTPPVAGAVKSDRSFTTSLVAKF